MGYWPSLFGQGGWILAKFFFLHAECISHPSFNQATTTVSKPKKVPPDEVHEVDKQEEENRALTADLRACQQVCEKTWVPLSVGRGGGFHLISSPCIQWLRVQYVQQSKWSCPTKATQQVFFHCNLLIRPGESPHASLRDYRFLAGSKFGGNGRFVREWQVCAGIGIIYFFFAFKTLLTNLWRDNCLGVSRAKHSWQMAPVKKKQTKVNCTFSDMVMQSASQKAAMSSFQCQDFLPWKKWN